jgi:hypothetical protein
LLSILQSLEHYIVAYVLGSVTVKPHFFIIISNALISIVSSF